MDKGSQVGAQKSSNETSGGSSSSAVRLNRRCKSQVEVPAPSIPTDKRTLWENRGSANLSGLSFTGRGRGRKPFTASPRLAVHFLTLINDLKEVLFRRKHTGDDETKALNSKGFFKERKAWKKLASELNNTHGSSLTPGQCRYRFYCMKRAFMQMHLPQTALKRVRLACPYPDLFRPIMRFVLNRSPVSGDDAKLKEILGSEAEPEESLVFEQYRTQYNEQKPVEGVQATDVDKERSDDPTDSDSGLSEDALETNHSKVPVLWSNEATKLFIKLLNEHKEILFSRKPEDPKRFAHGISRRRRSWKRIAIEINKAEVMRYLVRVNHCRSHFIWMRRTFIDLARPVKERIESQKARKTVWQLFKAFKPIMRYICDQYPSIASVGDRVRPSWRKPVARRYPTCERYLGWCHLCRRGRALDKPNMDSSRTESETEDDEENDFELEEGEEVDFSDDSDYGTNVATPFLKAPVRTPPVARDQPRASQALRIPFEMTNSKSMRLLSTHQGTSVEKVRSWDTDSSDSDSVPARPVRSIAKLTATATGSSVSSRRRRAIVRSLSSTDSDSSETRRGTPSRKRPAGEDKSAPPKRTKLVHAPHSTTHQNSQIIQTDSNQSSDEVFLDEIRAIRADIHALTGRLTHLVATNSELAANVQILLKQN